jgi:alpha-methylacyl-CoA racemase
MGPLTGTRIIEIAGLGPGPFAGMMLADMGAEVIRVERPGGGSFPMPPDVDFMNRGKRCIAVNLKSAEGIEIVLKLAETADAMIEGFRPGVMERLGLGPDVICQRNPKLVYARVTGWGQDGPWAQKVGHDINYIATTGALHAMGEKGSKPQIPLTLVGDFGGGGQVLAFGIACALFEAKNSGKGQIVDTAMVDGVASMMACSYSTLAMGFYNEERGTNILDSGAPFYDSYECADGEYVAVGAMEPQFYAELLSGLELDPATLPAQMDMSQWPALKDIFSQRFKTKSRDAWAALFEQRDACVTPILKMSEALQHPHLRERNTFVSINGIDQPAPSPRFSRTPGKISRQAATIGEHTDEILTSLSLDISALRASGAVS